MDRGRERLKVGKNKERGGGGSQMDRSRQRLKVGKNKERGGGGAVKRIGAEKGLKWE